MDTKGGRTLAAGDLDALIQILVAYGYTVVGPTVRDGAVTLAELDSAADLPRGWGVRVEAGRYELVARDDGAMFAHSAGPQSWKAFLHPERARLWSVERDRSAAADAAPPPRYAFVGVRPCDVRAIAIQDRVLSDGTYGDPVYTARRSRAFVVTVECTEPGATCFCASMGTGPAAGSGYDLAMTEVVDERGHRFWVRAGSELGEPVLAELPCEPVDEHTARNARDAVAAAAERMGRAMPAVGLRELMARGRQARHWEDVAARCLSCANCTLVCPTCFCTTTEDVTDLTGEHAERWRRWDSCFDVDFSYLHGSGPVRGSTSSRYRQWLTHKLSTWHDQFGSSGCVGCGRCIAWCPAGIDLTEEVAALAAEAAAGAEHAEHAGGAGTTEERP